MSGWSFKGKASFHGCFSYMRRAEAGMRKIPFDKREGDDYHMV